MSIPHFFINHLELKPFYPIILVNNQTARDIDTHLTMNIDKYQGSHYKVRKLIYRFVFKKYEETKDTDRTESLFNAISKRYNIYRTYHGLDKTEFFSNEEVKYIMYSYFIAINGLPKRFQQKLNEMMHDPVLHDVSMMYIFAASEKAGGFDEYMWDNSWDILQFERLHIALCKTSVHFQIHQKHAFRHYQSQLTEINEETYVAPRAPTANWFLPEGIFYAVANHQKRSF